MMKIAIIVRKETLERCTGRGCLQAFFQRIDSFDQYDENKELHGFTHEGGNLDAKIRKLKENGVETVHLSSCLRGKHPEYEALAKRLSLDFDVIGYTHGARQGRTREAICFKRQQPNK